jgi:hypothetical protein
MVFMDGVKSSGGEDISMILAFVAIAIGSASGILV